MPCRISSVSTVLFCFVYRVMHTEISNQSTTKQWFSLKVFLKRRNFGKFRNLKVKTLTFMVILEICLFYPIYLFHLMKLRDFRHETDLKFCTSQILCYDRFRRVIPTTIVTKRVKWHDFKPLKSVIFACQVTVMIMINKGYKWSFQTVMCCTK